MAKVTLGKRPKNFKHNVTFNLLDGTVGEVGIVYTYRTKREFAELIDKLDDEPQAADAAGDQKPMRLSEAMDMGLEANADYVLKIAEGWDLDAPFDREHLIQFGDEQPGGMLAIMQAYRNAITQGRLGN